MPRYRLPDTFGQAAPLLRRAGRAPLPLGPSKAPLIHWAQYRDRLPTDYEMADMLDRFGDARLTGMPIAPGEIVIDVDEEDPGKVRELRRAADRHLGETQAVRYGRTPRLQMLYSMADDHLQLAGLKRWDALQIMSYGGQIAVAGPHPVSGEAYEWESERHVPWASRPPGINNRRLEAFLHEARQICPPPQPAGPRVSAAQAAAGGSGLTAYYRSLAAVAGPAGAMVEALSIVQQGTRHLSLVAVIGAAVARGLDDDEIREAVIAGTVKWTWTARELQTEIDNALRHIRAAEATKAQHAPVSRMNFGPPRGPIRSAFDRKREGRA